ARLVQLGINVVRAYGGCWPCDFACGNRAKEVPIVVSVHDTNPSLLHESIHNADQVWAVSDAVKEVVMGKGVPAEKIRMLPNRVDFDVFYPCRDESLRSSFYERFHGSYRVLH